MSDSRHLVDPELLHLLDALPVLTISTDSLAQLRVTPRGQPAIDIGAAAAAVRVSTRPVKGPHDAPDVPLRIYQPPHTGNGSGCIFHIHGGGFVCGASAALEPQHRKLAADLDCVLVSVDYRLAPETAFPGNIEDCYAALLWLFEHAAELNVDAQRIGVMGESAGGGLAAALTLLARDRGTPPLAFQHLTYPMLDDRTCILKEPHPFTGEFVFTRNNNFFCWPALLGAPAGSKNVSPYAAPARAEDLTRLPPAFISTGALDLFMEENVEYARRLTRAGVPVELHVYPGAFHGFDLHPTAKVAQAARRDSFLALARFLDG